MSQSIQKDLGYELASHGNRDTHTLGQAETLAARGGVLSSASDSSKCPRMTLTYEQSWTESTLVLMLPPWPSGREETQIP